jgi:hypothetical protein
MNKIVFEFDENMMTICLLAHGWSNGWVSGRWLGPDQNADYGDFSTQEAFKRLLWKANLYGRQFEDGWKVK